VSDDKSPRADAATLAFYASEAPAYAARPEDDDAIWLDAFAAMAPRRMEGRRRVLELGCGDGRGAQKLIERGFEVTPTDGSPELAEQARLRLGRDVMVMRFDELEEIAAYEGVFANACLLHAPRAALPDIFVRVARALTPGGCFYASFKAGEAEGRDVLGRFYNYLSEAELAALYDPALWSAPAIQSAQGGGYDGAPTLWLHAFALKR
jgi:SAM-dependent methyltransferase